MGSRHRQSDYKIEIFNATFRESNLKSEENKFKVIFEVDTHGWVFTSKMFNGFFKELLESIEFLWNYNLSQDDIGKNLPFLQERL